MHRSRTSRSASHWRSRRSACGCGSVVATRGPRAAQAGEPGCGPTIELHADPAAEHVVVDPLDLVEDAGIEGVCGPQAVPRGGVNQLDARRGACVELAGAFDLPRDQIADGFVHAAAGEPVTVDPEAAQRLFG